MMFGLPPNQGYNTVPATPSDLSMYPYMIGAMLPQFMGGDASQYVVHPYVPQNQSLAGAWAAKYVNDPLYKEMMSSLYGQMGYQVGNTLGGTRMFQALGRAAGITPEQVSSDLRGLGVSAFSHPLVGGIVVPALDSLMSATGVSGGSFINAANTVFQSRMALAAPGSVLNPYDHAQQSMAMSGASSALQIMNAVISERDKNGNMTVKADPAFTRGFDRETIAGLMVKMAGAGAFTRDGLGFTERLSAEAGGRDLRDLDFSTGDLTGEGEKKNVDKDTARRIARMTKEFRERMSDGIDALGAMRDMLKTVDGIEEKLTALTSGRWLRGGSAAREAKAAVRRLDAVTQMYNIDPNKAFELLADNRSVLQSAAGFTPDMQALGFDGGGLFGLSGQTTLLAAVEDMINARGLRGDPVRSARLRGQMLQVAAQGMNSQAGRASQLLAYARQTGVVSEEEAEQYRQDLTSGDRSVMTDALDRLSEQVFGSAQRGRQKMNDSMFVNTMRQSLTDESGDYAWRVMLKGAEREYVQHEALTSAKDRLAFMRETMSGLGVQYRPSNEDSDSVAAGIARDLAEADGGGDASSSFSALYKSLRDGGMRGQQALQRTIQVLSKNPETRKFGERMQLTQARLEASGAEDRLVAMGSEGGQAFASLQSLSNMKAIDSKQYAEGMRLVRENPSEALAFVRRLEEGLSPEMLKLQEGARAGAVKRYEAARRTIGDNRAVDDLVSTASKSNISSDAAAESYEQVVSALRNYRSSRKTDRDADDFFEALDRSQARNIFGEELYNDVVASARSPGANDASMADMQETLGRRLVRLRQVTASSLRADGYGLSTRGFWGGGQYAGNAIEAQKRRDEAIESIVQKMDESDTVDAKDRKTFAADLIDWATGDKSIAEVLKVYDKSGTMSDMAKDLIAAREEYDRKSASYAKTWKGVSELRSQLNRDGKLDAVKELDSLVTKSKDVTPEQLDAFRDKYGVDPGVVEKMKLAFDSKNEAEAAREKVVDEAKSLAGNEEYGKAAKAAHANKEFEDRKKATQQAAYADTFGYMDRVAMGLEPGDETGERGDKLKAAYELMSKAVTDDQVKERLGVDSLEGVNAATRNWTRMSLLKEQALRGDDNAVQAMSAFKVAQDESKQVRMTGTVTVKLGDETHVGLMEAEVGGLS